MKNILFIIVLVDILLAGCHKEPAAPSLNARTFAGVNGAIYSMTIYNGNLVVGGIFDSVGSISATDIALWDGSKWSSVCFSNSINSSLVINSLCMYNGNLIAGTGCGDNTPFTGSVFQWNGSSWTTIGNAYY